MANRKTKRRHNKSHDDSIHDLLDAFERCHCASDLPSIRDQVVAAMPEAKEACLKVAQPDAVDATLEAIAGVMAAAIEADMGAVERVTAMQSARRMLAPWMHLSRLVCRLQAPDSKAGDPIAAFVRHAIVARDAAVYVVEAIGAAPSSCDDESPGYCVPHEWAVIADVIAPPVIQNVANTPFHRAMQAARRRGELQVALDLLTPIDKALSDLAQLLRTGDDAQSLFGSPFVQRLNDAISEAMVLVGGDPIGGADAQPHHVDIRTGGEAVQETSIPQPDADAFLLDRPMSRDESRVLRILASSNILLTQIRIAAIRNLPKERTLRGILLRFRELKLTHRPHGRNGGEGITPFGRAVAARLPEDCRLPAD